MSHCQPAQRLSIQSSIHHEMIELWNQLAELFEMQPNGWRHTWEGDLQNPNILRKAWAINNSRLFVSFYHLARP